MFAGFVCQTTDAFAFEPVEEAIGNRIVMAISAPAHRMFKVMNPQEGSPIPAGILRALIGVDQDSLLWLTPPVKIITTAGYRPPS